MRTSTRALSSVLVLVLVLMAAACGGSSGSSEEGSGSPDGTWAAGSVEPIVISVTTEPSTLDPQAVSDRSARVVTDNVFEGLLGRDADYEIVPSLATSYEPLEDGLTWRFVLRDGVTFQNGEPFDAEAAAYSINRIIDPDFETQRTSYIDGITGATVVDATTIDVTTEEVDATLPFKMTQLAMVPPVAAAADDFGDKPVGTGPYQVTSWNRGTAIEAERYDGYWGDTPETPAFTVRVIPDAQTSLAALETGEVDLVIDILPEQEALAPKVESIPATEFSYIAFNTYKDELKDPKVRVAMNMAIDRELLAESIYQGEATPLQGQMLDSTSVGFNSDLSMYPYDPEGAKELLAEAGYPDGFAVTLNVPIGRYPKLEEAAQVVADELSDIGIDVTISQIEWNTFREDGRIKGDEPGAYDLKMAWNSNEWFDSARIASHITCKGSSSKYCNEEVDALMDEGRTTLDPAARQEIYEKMWAILHDDPHAIYLLQQNLTFGLSDRLSWQPRLDDQYLVSTMSLSS